MRKQHWILECYNLLHIRSYHPTSSYQFRFRPWKNRERSGNQFLFVKTISVKSFLPERSRKNHAIVGLSHVAHVSAIITNIKISSSAFLFKPNINYVFIKKSKLLDFHLYQIRKSFDKHQHSKIAKGTKGPRGNYWVRLFLLVHLLSNTSRGATFWIP